MIGKGYGLLACAALAATLAACLPRTSAQATQDDPEARALKGAQIFRDNCLMCHSAELYNSQRLTADQWKAEITKMVGWGAPVPPDEQPILLEHLIAHFGEDVPPASPGTTTIAKAEASVARQDDPGREADSPADTARGGELFATLCASCHGKEARGGDAGTNLVEKPVLTRPNDFRDVLRKGRNKMPSFQAALDRKGEHDVLAWLKGRP